MTEPLTIYECPLGHLSSVPTTAGGRDPDAPKCYVCLKVVVPIRVFREEDVRPLWEAAQGAKDMLAMPAPIYETAVDAFPAPEEWK